MALANVAEDGGGGVLRIPIIRAQLGDSMRQLFDSVLFAETHNYRTVCLSWQSYRKPFALSLPKRRFTGRQCG